MGLSGSIGTWTPGIGDPSFIGWFTVAAFGLSAYLCWRARRVANQDNQAGAAHRSSALWALLSMGLVALGVNKQLDLQSALTEWGRATARAQGWYEHREALEVGFIAAVLLLAATLCVGLAFLARHEMRRMLLALIGWTSLCAFVAIRAASFHHIERLLGRKVVGGEVNSILELGGIALIALGALIYRRSPK